MSDRGDGGGDARSGEDPAGEPGVQEDSTWLGDHRTLTFPARAPEPTLKRLIGAPERFYDWWFRRFDARVEKKRDRIVEAHAAGTAIVARLRAEDSLTFEDWDVYHEIADPVLPRTGWPFTLDEWLRERGPLRRYERLEAFLQRAVRGWADRDAVDLDHYLAGVIAGSLRHLARATHGWPGEGSGWASQEAWIDAVVSLSDDFDRLRWPGRDRGERPSLTDVMGNLAKLWPTLWD
jgi:hypothetical protein